VTLGRVVPTRIRAPLARALRTVRPTRAHGIDEPEAGAPGAETDAAEASTVDDEVPI